MRIKKHLTTSLLSLLLVASASTRGFAASQTVSLAPTSVTVGHALVTPLGDFGGGISNISNALQLDSQTASFDPSSSGPGPDGGDSYLFLNYPKDQICPEAVINSVTVHAYWSQSADDSQNDVSAGLWIPNTQDTLETTFTAPSTYTQLDTFFGGLVNSAYIAGGTYSGNPPPTITHEYSQTQVVPSISQLTNPAARIVVTIGEQSPSLKTGELDYAYLEVNYDDEACNPAPTPVSQSPVSPKTGIATSMVVGISAALAAVLITLRTAKKLKARH